MAISAPPKPPGDRLASYFENFFRGTIGIATFGASITFSKITDAPTSPAHDFGFSPSRIQYLIAISWLFFVLTLAATSFAASALSLYRPLAVSAFNGDLNGDGVIGGKGEGEGLRRRVLWFATMVAGGLFALLVVAFVALGLVVVAYVGAVGWVAVGFTILFAATGFVVLVWQSPLRWPPLWLGAFRGRRKAAGGGGVEEKERRGEGGERGREDLVDVPRVRGGVKTRGGEEGAYGRSSSGDYEAGAGGRGGDWRRGRDDKYERYSRTSTVMTDPYEPGRFGQGGMMVYDTGVREGLVMSRYPG